jgi:hypothetical protein
LIVFERRKLNVLNLSDKILLFGFREKIWPIDKSIWKVWRAFKKTRASIHSSHTIMMPFLSTSLIPAGNSEISMKGTSTSTSLGNISLTVSIAGLIATEMALRQGLVAGAGWKVLLQAFEAATIGGFADWFAVSALFREVPVPLIRRHTNIIIKNRERIVEGIADMVQNRWLAPDIIREHLAHFSASKTVLD